MQYLFKFVPSARIRCTYGSTQRLNVCACSTSSPPSSGPIGWAKKTGGDWGTPPAALLHLRQMVTERST